MVVWGPKPFVQRVVAVLRALLQAGLEHECLQIVRRVAEEQGNRCL